MSLLIPLSNYYRQAMAAIGIPIPTNATQAAAYNTNPTPTGFTDESTNGTPRDQQVGRAYDFDGVDDEIDLGGSLDLKPGTGSMSWAYWVNPDVSGNKEHMGDRNLGANGTGVEGYVFGSVGSSTPGDFQVLFEAADGNRKFPEWNNFYTATEGWYHVTVVFDRTTDSITVYKNAEEKPLSIDNANDSLVGKDISSPENLFLGNRPNTTGRYFDGKMFDVRIYNKSLTKNEIINIYTFGDYGTDPTTTNLVAQYKCDDTHSTIAYDSSGNGNNGTKTNITASTFHYEGADVPYSFQDEVGFSEVLNFDGVDDYLSSAVGNDLDFGTGDINIKFKFMTNSVTDWQQLITKQNSTVSNRPGWQVSVASAGTLRMNIGEDLTNATKRTYRDSTAILPNTAYDVEIVWDSSAGTIDFTLNGSSANGSYGDQAGSNYNTDNNGDVLIGGWNDAINDRWYLNGWMKDVNVNDQFISSIGHTPVDTVNGNIITNNGATEGFLPRDESDTTKDVLGNPLQYSGRVPYNAVFKQSGCGHFDGIDDKIQTNIDFGGSVSDFSFSCRINADTLTDLDYFFDNSQGSVGLGFRMSNTTSGALQVFSFGTVVRVIDGVTLLSTGEDYTIGFVVTSTSTKIYVNGVLDREATYTDNGNLRSDSTGAFIGGQNAAGNTYDGKMYDVRAFRGVALTDADMLAIHNQQSIDEVPTIHYVFGEGGGETIYDVSGNDNHGIATNITESSFWDTQDVYHYNITNGHSIATTFSVNVAYSAAAVRSTDNAGRVVFVLKDDASGGSSNSVWSATNTGNFSEYIGLRINASGQAEIVDVTSGSQVVAGSTNIRDGQWHTVEISSNGSSYTLVVDGNTETLTGSNTGKWFNDISGYNAFTIGKIQTSINDSFFFGSIAKVELYDGSDTLVHQWGAGGDWSDATVEGTPAFLRLPALADGSDDVAGIGITNPVGGHNKAETQLDFTGGVDTVWSNNIYNGADFDGTNDYIDCGNDSSLDITGELTLEFNMNFADLSGNRAIVTKYSALEGERGYGCQLTTTGVLQFYYQSQLEPYNANQRIDYTELDDGTDKHVILTYKPSTYARVFVNGLMVAEKTTNIPSAIVSTPQSLKIGKLDNNYANGKIWDVRIYNKALEQNDVTKRFQGEQVSGYQGEWKLLGNAYDSSGNDNHGTNNGATFTKTTLETDYAFGDTRDYPNFKTVDSPVKESQFRTIT